MLVKSGADANLPMGDGQTAVHVAAVGGNLAVLRVLLQNGGDAQIADKEGETALHKVKSFSFFVKKMTVTVLTVFIECWLNLFSPKAYSLAKLIFSRVQREAFRWMGQLGFLVLC